MVFQAWAHERVPLNSQWPVLRIGGADFLHSWVANSIWLERAESLIRYSPVTTSHTRDLSRVVPRVIQREEKMSRVNLNIHTRDASRVSACREK